MYHVYVIKNQDCGKIYIGQTDNLEKRIKQHNDSKFDIRAYTKLNKGNWLLVYRELLKQEKKR